MQLGVPESRADAELLELADGLAAVAAEHGVGDRRRRRHPGARRSLVAVTAVGEAPRRRGAGDARRRAARRLVAVTGELGGAAAGLLLLQRPELAEGLDARGGGGAARAPARARPAPRGGPRPGGERGDRDDRPQRRARRRRRPRRGGERRRALDRARAPAARSPGSPRSPQPPAADPLDLATAGGEDYELLAAIPPERSTRPPRAVAAAGVELSVIGAVEAGAGVELRDRGARGGARRASTSFALGERHLRPP